MTAASPTRLDPAVQEFNPQTEDWRDIMRRTNWRFVLVGLIMMVAAAGFFLEMGAMAPRSNDPVALMRTVGEVSGVVGALGLVLALLGLRGKRF
jgi:hypothetical protein